MDFRGIVDADIVVARLSQHAAPITIVAHGISKDIKKERVKEVKRVAKFVLRWIQRVFVNPEL